MVERFLPEVEERLAAQQRPQWLVGMPVAPAPVPADVALPYQYRGQTAMDVAMPLVPPARHELRHEMLRKAAAELPAARVRQPMLGSSQSEPVLGLRGAGAGAPLIAPPPAPPRDSAVAMGRMEAKGHEPHGLLWAGNAVRSAVAMARPLAPPDPRRHLRSHNFLIA